MRVDELIEGANADQQQRQEPAPDAAQQPGSAPAQPGGEQGPGGTTQASPEQQEAYDRIVMAGLTVLNEITDQILGLIQQQAEDLPKGIADATLLIVQQLDEKAGGEIPRDILFHAALEILENVVEFALQAGIGEVNKQTQNKAGQLLLMGLADNYGPEMTRFMEGAIGLMQEMPEEEFAAILREQAGLEEGGGGEPAAAPGGQPAQPGQDQQGLIAQKMRG